MLCYVMFDFSHCAKGRQLQISSFSRKVPSGRLEAQNVNGKHVLVSFRNGFEHCFKLHRGAIFLGEICTWALGGTKCAQMNCFGLFSVVDMRIAQNCPGGIFLQTYALGRSEEQNGHR